MVKVKRKSLFPLDEGPTPCVLSGCDVEVVEARALCPMHELRYMALTGRSSPLVVTSQKWHQALRTRARWARVLDPTIYRAERKNLWDIRERSNYPRPFEAADLSALTKAAAANGKGSGG